MQLAATPTSHALPFNPADFATLTQALDYAAKGQDLFTWFMQREQPVDEELAAIVSQILRFTHTAPEDR